MYVSIYLVIGQVYMMGSLGAHAITASEIGITTSLISLHALNYN